MDKKSLPKISAAIKSLSLVALMLPVSARENVVFNFVETGITCGGRPCPLPAAPRNVVAELILPGPNSSGSAEWLTGNPILPGDPPPVWKGDPFIFSLGDAVIRYNQLAPENMRNYSISWEETDSELTSISVSLVTDRTGARLSLTGGMVNTDGFIAGCEDTSCQVVGSWINSPPGNLPQLIVATAEPGSLGLLCAALLGICGIRRKMNGDRIMSA
jgi:hypothetical protein